MKLQIENRNLKIESRKSEIGNHLASLFQFLYLWQSYIFSLDNLLGDY